MLKERKFLLVSLWGWVRSLFKKDDKVVVPGVTAGRRMYILTNVLTREGTTFFSHDYVFLSDEEAEAMRSDPIGISICDVPGSAHIGLDSCTKIREAFLASVQAKLNQSATYRSGYDRVLPSAEG